MKTYPIYFKFGETELFHAELSSDEARDAYFATEEINLSIQNKNRYLLDERYEAPMFRNGAYYFIFKEQHNEVQQPDNT